MLVLLSGWLAFLLYLAFVLPVLVVVLALLLLVAAAGPDPRSLGCLW